MTVTDLRLSELSVHLGMQYRALNNLLVNSELDTAFLAAMEVERLSKLIQERLNELKYSPEHYREPMGS